MTSKLSTVSYTLMVLILFASLPLMGQNCDSAVVDEIGVGGVIRVAKMVAEGAEVRVRAIRDMSPAPNLEYYERSLESSCASWRSPSGTRKNNLIVFVLELAHRKTGMWYGSEWNAALDGRWPMIQQQFMTPRFRDHDFAGGLQAGIDQAQILLYAHNHAGAGTTGITVNPPADYSGLWSFLKWLLFIGSVIFAFIYGMVLLVRRKREREERRAAQQSAINARQDAAQALTEVTSVFDVHKDLGTYADARGILDDACGRFTTLMDSPTGDPSRDDYSVGQYKSLAESYAAVSRDLRRAKRVLLGIPEETEPAWKATREHESQDAPTPILGSNSSGNKGQPVVVQPTSSSSTSIFAPVIINEEHVSESEYHHTDYSSSDSGSSRSSGSSVSDSGGGGSSDWGSSSSDSGGGGDSGSSGGDSSGGGGDSSW
jgi:uncharacterized membrane protein YgcG